MADPSPTNAPSPTAAPEITQTPSPEATPSPVVTEAPTPEPTAEAQMPLPIAPRPIAEVQADIKGARADLLAVRAQKMALLKSEQDHEDVLHKLLDEGRASLTSAEDELASVIDAVEKEVGTVASHLWADVKAAL